VITVLDEKKLLGELPRYVVDNTDSIPTLRLEDGEMQYFVKKMDRFEEALTHLQACFNMQYSSGEKRPPVFNSLNSTTGCNSKTSQPLVAASESGMDTWASHVSRDLVDQLPTSDMDTDNTGGGYMEVVNSRRKKRRLRHSPLTPADVNAKTHSNVNVNTDTNNQRSVNTKTNKDNRRQHPLVIGRRRPSASNLTVVAAAKPLIAKEVFCIDNVDITLNVDDIIQFVKAMDVRVISCYETRPRRTMKERRENEFPADRKAFRLCIVKEDRRNLLVDDNWPTNITVSSWFFKGQSASAAVSMGRNEATNVDNDPDKTVLTTNDDEGTVA
jgi:hypothetical protein